MENKIVKWENVYIFISSTFNDMHAERDYLVKRVFPELSAWCEERRLRLIDIDLRWGVSEADATQNKRVVQVCLDRIDECRPFFLCFLGQRRGWVPENKDVNYENIEQKFPLLIKESEEDEKVKARRSKGKSYLGNNSVTEMEIIHALIDPLHNGILKDKDGSKTEHAFFFLREPDYLHNLPYPDLEAVYTNKEEKEKDTADKELNCWREKIIPETGRPIVHYSAVWNTTESTPEIALTDFVPTTSEYGTAIWKDAFRRWQKRWEKAGIKVDKSGIIAEAEKTKAKNYNEKFTGGRLGNFQDKNSHEDLDKIIIRLLKGAITKRYGERKVEQLTSLQKELDQQEQFLRIANEGFIERKGDFDELNKYINTEEETRPLAVTAYAGMGKTSLLAHYIDKYKLKTNETLHYRFIGCSNDSTNKERLVRSLLNELKGLGKIKSNIPVDTVEMFNKIPDLLEEAGKKGKTIIIMDALNQLETGMTNLYWIPNILPQNIKLIVSFKLGDTDTDKYYEEQKKSKAMVFSSVKTFEQDDRRSLVIAYLSQYFKELDESQIEALISSEGAENPLFLKIALSELRVFGVHNDLTRVIQERFGTSTVSAFDAMLKRIERDPSYTGLKPAVAMPHIFGWLTHSRHGLSVEELSDLLMREKLTDNVYESYDVIFLVIRQLRPFLAKRDGRIDFFYESFKTAAKERYTNHHTYSRSSEEWHKSLAEYFETLPYFDDTEREKPNLRKAVELAYQWRNACAQDFLRTVSVIDWMDAVQKAFGVDFMLEEMADMPAATPDWLLSVRKAIFLSSTTLRSDFIGVSQLYGDRNAEFSEMLKTTQVNFYEKFKGFIQSFGIKDVREMGKNLLVEQLFLQFGHDTRSGLSNFLKEAADTKRSVWLRSCYARPTRLLDDALISSYSIGGVPLMVHVTSDGQFAAVCEFKSIKVWNLHDNRLVKSFNAPDGYLPAEAFISEDANWVAANFVDFSGHFGVSIWDVMTGRLLFKQIDTNKEWSWDVVNLNRQNCVEFYVRKKGIEDPYLLAFHPEEEDSLFCLDSSSYDCCPDLIFLKKSGIRFTTRNEARNSWPYSKYRKFTACSFGVQSASQVSHYGRTIQTDSSRRNVELTMSNSSKIILGKHNADITNVTLSVNGEMAASCSNDRTVMLYDVNNKKIKGHLYGFSGNPVCVALDETGEKLFVTVNDGTIQVYDTNKITPLNDDVSAPHIGSVLLESVKYTSSGDVVSCGEDGYIKKWNPQTGKCFFSSKKITPRPESFTVSPDGLLMTYCYGEHCVIVDTKNDRELFRKHTGKITPYQMALNGRVVFITTRNGDLVRIFYRNRFWGQLKYSREQIGDGTIQSSILFADKQGFFAFCNTVSGKNKIHQYNLSGKKGKTINIHNTYHSGIRLQDGTMVLSGLGKIDFLSPTKGTVIRSIDTPPMSSHLIMAYSPCNNLIAATSSDSVLRVWNINADKGNELLAVFGGGKVFSSITFSPDGKQIIAGDESGLLTWFDIVFYDK